MRSKLCASHSSHFLEESRYGLRQEDLGHIRPNPFHVAANLRPLPPPRFLAPGLQHRQERCRKFLSNISKSNFARRYKFLSTFSFNLWLIKISLFKKIIKNPTCLYSWTKLLMVSDFLLYRYQCWRQMFQQCMRCILQCPWLGQS